MSLPFPLDPDPDPLTALEAQVLQLEDPRPHPPEAALEQLGEVIMTELLDLTASTALEDFQSLIAEALIGAFHSAAQRIERDADKARDALKGLMRDFDGSEVLDVELQDATRRTRAADVAMLAVELIRNAASATYTLATGEVWSPWKGSVRPSRTTAGPGRRQGCASSREGDAARRGGSGGPPCRLQGRPSGGHGRRRHPHLRRAELGVGPAAGMALATSGAKGGEKLAIKWAKQKNITIVLARADFERHGRAAPFRANDEILDLDPVCVITLDNSLNALRGGALKPFGPALNLAQKAGEKASATSRCERAADARPAAPQRRRRPFFQASVKVMCFADSPSLADFFCGTLWFAPAS